MEGAKVSELRSIIGLKQIPTFEWCVIRIGFKRNWTPMTYVLERDGLPTQILLTILSSIVNIFEEPYPTISRERE